MTTDSTLIASDSLVVDSVAPLPVTMLSLQEDTLMSSVPEFLNEVGLELVENPRQFLNETVENLSNRGLLAEEQASSPMIVNTIGLLIIVMFVLCAERFKSGYKYFTILLHRLFTVRLRENVFEDHTTINELFSIIVFAANSCIMQGLLAYYAVSHFGIGILEGTAAILMPVVCVLLSAVLFFFQLGLYNLLGYTFASQQQTKIWIEGYLASQTLMGVLLLPIVMMTNLSWGDDISWLGLGIFSFVLLRMTFVVKGFRIFFTKLQSSLYFILYLCSVEIIPVIALIAAIIEICNHIQS